MQADVSHRAYPNRGEAWKLQAARMVPLLPPHILAFSAIGPCPISRNHCPVLLTIASAIEGRPRKNLPPDAAYGPMLVPSAEANAAAVKEMAQAWSVP